MGKLIVIEGGDGAGKQTQFERALAKLRTRGPASYFDFPNYSSVVGRVIRESLAGDYGDFRNLHPKLAALPYALDRVAFRKSLYAALEMGHALCNRYTPSNAMYQAAKFSSHEEQEQFITWLEDLEYGELELPKPDLVIYLHVPYDVSQGLMQKRDKETFGGRPADQHERDTKYLRDVVDLYVRTALSRRETWKTIGCMKDGTLRSIEDIHQEVMFLIDQFT